MTLVDARIHGTHYRVQFEVGPPDPTCAVYVFVEGDSVARRIVTLSLDERDALHVELFDRVRGPVCDRIVAEMETAS